MTADGGGHKLADATLGASGAPGTADEAEQQLRALRETDQRRRKVFADISHELKAPLSIALALLDRMLGAHTLAADDRRDAEAVRRHVQTLLAQVSELLTAARLESNQLVLRLRVCDLAALVRRVTEDFAPLARSREVCLACDSPPQLLGRVDPERMAGVLANLLSNALRFTPPGGNVRLTLRAEHAVVHLAVADSGPGIPEELRTAVFERFHQADGLLAWDLGASGLGLTLVRDIVRLHGGEATVAQAPEGGALVSIVLPSITASVPSGHTSLSADVEELLSLSAMRLGSELSVADKTRAPPDPRTRNAPNVSAAGSPGTQAWHEGRELIDAFEQSPVGIGVLDLDGRWLRANAALCALLGLSEQQLRERTLESILHPSDAEDTRDHLQLALTGAIRGGELEMRVRMAGDRWGRVLMSLAVARAIDGQPSRVIAHMNDLGARRLDNRRRQLAATRDKLTGSARPYRLKRELGRFLRTHSNWRS